MIEHGQINNESVNPAMVTLARESRGLTQTELARRLAVSQALLSRIESGLAPVSSEQLLKLSTILEYPVGFFLQRDSVLGPGISEFFHRRRQDVSLKMLQKVHAIVNVRRIQVAKLLRSVDVPELKIRPIDLEEFGNRPAEVARAVRAAWQLPPGPIHDVIKTIEDAGGIVIRHPFGTPRIDALSRWVPGMPPLFFVNEGLPTDRERLTLCHELGHLVMHSEPSGDMEMEANRFAAEFLMPAKEIKPQLARVTLERLAALKPYWKVSMGALLVHAESLGVVSERMYRHLWMQMSARGYKKVEPAELDLPRETPGILQEIVDTYRHKFGYGLPELSQLLEANEDQLVSTYNLQHTPAEVKNRLRIVR